MPVSFVRTEAKKNILFAQSRKRNEKRFSVKKITLGPAGQSDNSRHRQTPCSYPNRNLLLSAAAAFRPSSAARICATRTASIRLRSTLTSTPRPPTLLYPRQGPSNDTLRHAPGGGGGVCPLAAPWHGVYFQEAGNYLTFFHPFLGTRLPSWPRRRSPRRPSSENWPELGSNGQQILRNKKNKNKQSAKKKMHVKT